MNKLYKYCAAAAVALTATSCANFLEEDPKGQMVVENFFKNDNDLTLALNALYSQVTQSQRHSNPYIVQLQGDDITINTMTKEAYTSADAFKDPSDDKGANDLWEFRYQVIQAANTIIENAEDATDATQEKINIALGNALYWRAYSYFELVRVFGPLPLNLYNLPDDNKTPMTGVEDIYKLIMEDLERANDLNLPASYQGMEYGFTEKCNYWVTSAAVKATLAAVYMNRGGYPFYKNGDFGTEWYGKAAELLKEVYDGVETTKIYELELEQDYGQVYSIGNNWSAEQLITVGYMDTPGTMTNFTSQFSKCQTPGQFQNGWIDFMGEYKWWANYPDGPRKNAVYEDVIYTSIKNSATDASNPVVCISWWATEDQAPVDAALKSARNSIYHPTFASMQVNAVSTQDQTVVKEPYDCRKPVYQGQSVPQNHRLIRYSEVLCWFAEAAARSGKYVTEAKSGLQKVLDRAYGAGVKSVEADMAEQAVLEHGYEVTGYPLALVTRRADLFRLDRLKEVWEYRHDGPQNTVIVKQGTPTVSYRKLDRTKYEEYTYTLDYDLTRDEDNPMADTWRDYESIYMIYPNKEVIKNSNIKRVSAMN